MYFSMPRHFGFSVLEDQQCAAALMWTCVTLVYLVPAAILRTRLLWPRSFFCWAVASPDALPVVAAPTRRTQQRHDACRSAAPGDCVEMATEPILAALDVLAVQGR